MKNKVFIIALAAIIIALGGWYIYISSQASEARSVQAVSVDWWNSAHADASAEAFTHEAHMAFIVELNLVIGCNSARFLPAMLQSVQPQVDRV